MSYRLGIDLGGTTAKIALVSGTRIVEETSVPTAGRPRVGEVARALFKAGGGLVKARRVASIGVGVAGDIDPVRGLVRISPNLGWKNAPLGALLGRAFGRRVLVENDANAAAWGLYKTQVAPSVRDVIAVTLGTGVGGGIILNGRLHRGATGSAGEIGHMTVVENGRRCNCGNRGCLEAYVGAPHLVAMAEEAIRAGTRTRLAREGADLSARGLAAAARAGDAYAKGVWLGVGRVLGLALGNLIYALNPELICLTGGVAQAGPLVTRPLMAALRERAFRTPVGAVRVTVAGNAAQVGVIGAALLE